MLGNRVWATFLGKCYVVLNSSCTIRFSSVKAFSLYCTFDMFFVLLVSHFSMLLFCFNWFGTYSIEKFAKVSIRGD